jgi:predicted nucleic acid-binding protein
VIDASVTASWIFSDERDAYSVRVADRVAAAGAVVPALWRWEIQNLLLSALRSKRIDSDALARYVSDLGELNIVFDFTPGFGTELALARKYALTVYDAAYLELAIRRNYKLATKDAELKKAAETAGVFLSPKELTAKK